MRILAPSRARNKTSERALNRRNAGPSVSQPKQELHSGMARDTNSSRQRRIETGFESLFARSARTANVASQFRDRRMTTELKLRCIDLITPPQLSRLTT